MFTGSYLDCQWLDVTGVAPGEYILRVTINPNALLIEKDYSNNSAEVHVRISKPGGSIISLPRLH